MYNGIKKSIAKFCEKIYKRMYNGTYLRVTLEVGDNSRKYSIYIKGIYTVYNIYIKKSIAKFCKNIYKRMYNGAYLRVTLEVRDNSRKYSIYI